MAAPADVDEYLATLPDEHRAILQAVREAIHRGVTAATGTAPEEKIRYGMPAVLLGGRYALHFAGWKKHLGLSLVPLEGTAVVTESEHWS